MKLAIRRGLQNSLRSCELKVRIWWFALGR